MFKQQKLNHVSQITKNTSRNKLKKIIIIYPDLRFQQFNKRESMFEN